MVGVKEVKRNSYAGARLQFRVSMFLTFQRKNDGSAEGALPCLEMMGQMGDFAGSVELQQPIGLH